MKSNLKKKTNRYRKLVQRLLPLLMVVFALLPPGLAQPTGAPYSLAQCLQYALQHSRDLTNAEYDVQLAKAQVKEVRSTGLPQINLNGQLQDNLILPTSLLPAEIFGGEAGTYIPVRFGTKYNVTGGGEVNQLLFSQTYLVGLKAAKVSEEFYRLNTRKGQEEVAYNVSAAYYNAQISARQLEITRGNLERLNRLAQIAEVQYKNGILKKSDADRIRVNTTNLQTQIANLETGYTQQLNLLKYLIGMPVTDSLQIVTAIDEPESGPLVINRDDNLFGRRTDYQLLGKQRELYSLERKNVQAGYTPTLSAFGNYQYQAMRNEFNFLEGGQPWFRTSMIGLKLNVPVFDGFKKQALAQQSYLRMKQTETKAEQLKESITLDVVNSNARLANSRTALAAQWENQQLAEQVYNQTQLQYKEGVASLSELLNAETDMRDAQNNYINALVQHQLAALELRKADGSLLPPAP